MRLAVVFVVALAFAAQASASRAPALEPAASWAAGKPVKVFCAGTYGEGGHVPYAGASDIYLDQELCSWLRGALSPADAGPLLVLSHEAVHASGVADEGVAECRALHLVAGMASRFFGFTTWQSRHRLMEQAWDAHRALPAEYRTVC